MSEHTNSAPPAAPSGPGSDEAALRDLLRQRLALFPALRRAGCPQETFTEYLAVCGGIVFIEARIGVARCRAIKREVYRETPAAPERAVVAPGKGGDR